MHVLLTWLQFYKLLAYLHIQWCFFFRNVSFNQTLQQPINELLLPEPESEVIYPKDQNIGIEVYDNFSFDHKYDNTLPITDSRELIVQTIDANRATVIQGT